MSQADSARVVQHADNGTADQQRRLVHDGGGYFRPVTGTAARCSESRGCPESAARTSCGSLTTAPPTICGACADLPPHADPPLR
jgi:hypothetical protein